MVYREVNPSNWVKNNPLSFYGVASHSTDYSYTEEIVRNANTIGNIWQDQNGDKYSQNTNQLLLGNLMFGINKNIIFITILC